MKPVVKESIHLLLVEDDPLAADALRQTLLATANVDYRVSCASSLQVAQEMLGRAAPEVVLLDLNLPDSTGLETFRKLHQRLPSVPVIILTGNDDERFALEAMREGAQDYVVKGLLDPRLLSRVVRYAIERKRVAEQLRHREEFFRLITENVTDLIVVTDSTGKRIYNSPSYKNLLGNPESFKGTDSFAEIHPDDRQKIKGVFERTLQNGLGERAEYRFVLSTGEIRHVESIGNVIKDEHGNPLQVVVVSRDITERKDHDEALIQSEKRYKRLVASTTDYIFTVNIQQGLPVSTLHGPGCIAVTGYSPEDYRADGMLWYQMIHEEDRGAVLEQVRRIMSGETPGPVEHRLRHQNGSWRWVKNTVVPRVDDRGRLLAYDGLISDITERKRAEEELQEERNLLVTLINTLPDCIYIKDLQSRFVLANLGVTRLMGAEQPESLTGKTDFDFYPAELAQRYFEDEQAVVGRGEPMINREEPAAHGKGETRWLLTSKIPLKDRRGELKGLVGIGRDITEHKKSAEELKAAHLHLMQAEKMESIGTLAAGIAHEVKNPLQIVLMGINYLSKALKDPSEDIQVTLTDMHTAVKRADGIIRGLLEFAASYEPKAAPEDLNEIIRSSIGMVKYEMTKKPITLVQELAEDLPRLKLDKNKLHQVFINLLLNAIQAMPDGGNLCVRTRRKKLAEVKTDGSEAVAGDTVHIQAGGWVVVAEVEDSGTGIPADKLNKIFDPFFTTKPPGKGTGLGLTVVKKIVELHGGSIDIRNKPGGGGVRVTLVFKPWKSL